MVDDKIIFIIDENREFLFDGSSFSEVPSKNLKNYLNASIVPSSTIRTHGFKTKKTTTIEKIEIQAEMNMYEDGGLDPDVDFSISSHIIELENSEDIYVESYAVEVSVLDEMFASSVKKYGYLDLIFTPSLCYSALYANGMLEDKNDLFIYIGDDNAYAVIFKNGKYISTRTIATINEMAQKIGVDAIKMKETLINKGVKDDLYGDDDFVLMSDTQEQFSKIVERVAHSIGHKRGIFGLDSLDRIFLDFEGSDIPGFLDLFDSYGYNEASKELLDVFIDTKVGMKHYALNALYALCAYQEKLDPVNLTRYERRPTFLKTKVGEFSMVMMLSFILASAYPIYAMIELDKLNGKESDLKTSLLEIKQVTKKLQTKLKIQRKQTDKLKLLKNKKIATINSYNDMVSVLEEFDNDILLREVMFRDINSVMKKYQLSSRKFEFIAGDFVSIQVIAKNYKRDDIAKFIKELLYLGYGSVTTKKVQKHDTYYESFVEIKR